MTIPELICIAIAVAVLGSLAGLFLSWFYYRIGFNITKLPRSTFEKLQTDLKVAKERIKELE